MRRFLVIPSALLLLIAVASCAKKAEEGAAPPAGDQTQAAAPSATTDTAAAPAGWTVPAGLDAGARAAEEPVDEAVAAQGGALFKSKGCVTCHGFGKKVIGPDLLGVPKQRTSSWMIAQILHPDVMIQQDSISKSLLAQYKVPMTNLRLTPTEAKSIIEYLKQRDRAGK